MNNIYVPYRVCPIGAHSDHQHGFVTGFAIDKGIRLSYRVSDDSTCEVSSRNFEGVYRFDIGAMPPRQRDWADYLRGAADALLHTRKPRRGIVCELEGQLPIGGLSSSAAVVIAFISALCEANDLELTEHELIETAVRAENEYVGVSCGRLDQSCIVRSRKDHLLYLDTRDESCELIPANPSAEPFEIAVFFSGIERTLAGSSFNTRVDEMKSAAYALMAYSGMPYSSFSEARLRVVEREVFEAHKDKLPENWRKRATHFYAEMQRVHAGAQAWREGDIRKFGRYVFESGYSSIHNYQTGSPQLKALYDIMLDTQGIYGGRFSGAGYNGCCVALTHPQYRDRIAGKVEREYLRTFPELEGKFSAHFCRTADGAAGRL